MRKVAKLFCVMAAAAALLCSLLVGCTDKEQPRVLDEVEKSITGTWTSAPGSDGKGTLYVFYSNGTYGTTSRGAGRYEYKHAGWVDNGTIRYELIRDYGLTGEQYWELADGEPDTLYIIDENGYLKPHLTRVDRNQLQVEYM